MHMSMLGEDRHRAIQAGSHLLTQAVLLAVGGAWAAKDTAGKHSRVGAAGRRSSGDSRD